MKVGELKKIIKDEDDEDVVWVKDYALDDWAELDAREIKFAHDKPKMDEKK